MASGYTAWPIKFLLFQGLASACATTAYAADLPCGPAEKGTVTLDGLTDDWADVEGLDAGGTDSNLSFTIKCNVEPETLYLLVDVRDNYFVRTKQTRPGEDHLELGLGGRKLMVFPGDAGAIPDRVTWAPGRPAKGVRSASALQAKGWAVELAVPLGQLPGYRKGASGVRFHATVADCDSKASLKTERTVEVAGSIEFAEAGSALEEFLKERGLTRASITWERSIALGHRHGGRILFADKYLVLISDGYVYQELPFRDRRDLKDARLVDLAGDGREALVLRYLEHGGGGSREVLAAYRQRGESQLARVFACEVGKSSGVAHVEDKVSFVKRGKANDIVVEAARAVGFTQASYREAQAEDMIPILLPWGGERRARYRFHGEEYQRAR
jgi:hypothetical protein